MFRLPILTVALAILAALLQSSRATLAPDLADAVAWYDSLGYPDTKDLPYVRVATGAATQEGANPPENTFVEGFLLSDDPKEFAVFICSVSSFEDRFRFFEPYPVLTTARFVPNAEGPAHRRVAYEELDLDAVAQDALLRVRARASAPEPDRGLQWGRPVSHRVRIFAFARACLHRPNLAETAGALLELAADIPDEQTGQVDRQAFTSTLQRQFGDAVLTAAEVQFGKKDISWEELLMPYEHFADRFPASLQLGYAHEAAQVLRSVIAEEAAHDPMPLEQMTPVEQAGEYIYQLRNLGRCTWIMNGKYPVDARVSAGPEVVTPIHRLVDLGYDAVPQLIAAMEDRRFTRCMFEFFKMQTPPRVMRVGDVAERILDHLSGRNFHSRRRPDGTPIETTARLQAEAWWAEVQSKGEKRLLMETAAKGGEEGERAARKLVERYPDAALDAIQAGFHATGENGTRARFVELAGLIPGEASLLFLRSKLGADAGVFSQVEAAKALSARGDAAAVPAMIITWTQIQPRLLAGAGDVYFEAGKLITFLAKSGSADAINALHRHMGGAPVDVRLGIVRVFAPWARSAGLSASGRSVSVDADIRELPGGEAGRAIEKLLMAALHDREKRMEMAGHYNEMSYKDPRICDMAALVLAARWPEKYAFDWPAREADRDAQIALMRGR